MIVTTGKSIKIDVDGYLHLERSCETPGKVTLRRLSRTDTTVVQCVDLPAHPDEAERLIKAYRRALAEDIPYREMTGE